MSVRAVTRHYEAWLARTVPVVPADLRLKHRLMAANPFSFLRATFYRWSRLWPEVCPELVQAPAVLAIGDLHVENFGTWRDAEGRLIWGVNDFDETATLPYTQDLVRLATSALLAIEEARISVSVRRASAAILEGYTDSLRRGGGPAVLAEHYRWLRDLAIARLKDQRPFWDRLRGLPDAPPHWHSHARRLLKAALHEAHRQAPCRESCLQQPPCVGVPVGRGVGQCPQVIPEGALILQTSDREIPQPAVVLRQHRGPAAVA